MASAKGGDAHELFSCDFQVPPNKIFRVPSCPPVLLSARFQHWLPDCPSPGGSSPAQAPCQAQSPHLGVFGATSFHFHPGSSSVSPQCHPSPPQPMVPRPLWPLTFLSPAKIPGSLSQVEKWFISIQFGTFSEPPLPLAHFYVWARPRELENSSPSLAWVSVLACQQSQIFKAIMKMSSESHARALKGIRLKTGQRKR